jgi:4-carboxymuconolactone decarboxylase
MPAGETAWQRGERLLRKIDGDRVADSLLRAYEGVAPDFTRYLVEFAFGEIYARDGDLRAREAVAIASLATMGGCDAQLAGFGTNAKPTGLTTFSGQPAITP